LSFIPKRGRFVVKTAPGFRKLDHAASAIGGRGSDSDQAVTFQKTNHLAHRRPFDVEPLRKGVDRGAPHLVQGCQGEELGKAQAGRLKVRVVKARDLPGRLPHGEAVALIDSKRLADRLHLSCPFGFY
jgi:hypothetical protein